MRRIDIEKVERIVITWKAESDLERALAAVRETKRLGDAVVFDATARNARMVAAIQRRLSGVQCWSDPVRNTLRVWIS